MACVRAYADSTKGRNFYTFAGIFLPQGNNNGGMRIDDDDGLALSYMLFERKYKRKWVINSTLLK